MGPSPKKICLVTPAYPPQDWGGLARTAARLAGHLRSLGLEVQAAELLAEDSDTVLLDENRETLVVDGVTLHRIRAGREFFGGRNRTIWDCPHTYTLRMWHQSLALLQEQERYDLLCAFFLYPMGYLTTMLARQYGLPSVVGLMGNDIKKYLFSPEKVGMCRAGLEGASRIVSLSQEMADMAQALTPVRDKTRLVYGSVDPPGRAWQPRPRAGRPFRFGFAGSFKYAKGLPYLFKALGELSQKFRVELELAGEVRESEQSVYETVKERAGVEGLVRFKGAIPHQEMANWLLGLDGFVLPSVSEGCPNILLEAMACGLPCVSTRVGATPVIMEDKVSGLLVPAGDSRTLARAMGALIDRPDKAAALGAAARERIREFFSPEKEKQGWEAVFRELIDF